MIISRAGPGGRYYSFKTLIEQQATADTKCEGNGQPGTLVP